MYSSFLIKSLFTKSLSLLKSKGTCNNLLKLAGTFFKLSISNLSTLDFMLAKSIFSANFHVSTSVAFFKSDFVA